jgi:hypothetical protein
MERSGLAARETQSFLLGHFLASYSGHPQGLLATFRKPCDCLSFLVATRGASAACGGFAPNTAATFDLFYWLQVTNYGVLYVLFNSAPSGSNCIDVWDLFLHAQTASPIIS